MKQGSREVLSDGATSDRRPGGNPAVDPEAEKTANALIETAKLRRKAIERSKSGVRSGSQGHEAK